MSSMFDPDVAAALQYVTLPLELIGLLLALIEVRFPRAAASLTRQIARLAAPMEALRSDEPFDRTAPIERSLGLLLRRVIHAGFLLLTLFFLLQMGIGLLQGEAGVGWLLGFLIGYLIAGIIMTVMLVVVCVVTYFLVISSSDFAQRFVAGHAIGTLGILIAGLGLLGEVYQLLTQMMV
ncbi:MAG: hypothetical protein ACFHX7_07580 [Pseudomonadota bacterium]